MTEKITILTATGCKEIEAEKVEDAPGLFIHEAYIGERGQLNRKWAVTHGSTGYCIGDSFKAKESAENAALEYGKVYDFSTFTLPMPNDFPLDLMQGVILRLGNEERGNS